MGERHRMMRRSLSSWFLAVTVTASAVAITVGAPLSARAQEEDPEMTFDEDDAKKPPAEDQPAEGEVEGETAPSEEPEPDGGASAEGEIDLGTDPTLSASAKSTEAVESKISWQDIVVVVRKPFLKQHRVELLPTWGITMNDNIIRHFQFAGAINYYLTDVLAVGVEGQYYIKDLREPYDLVARQARRLP